MRFIFDLDDTLVAGDVIKSVATKMYAEDKIDRIYTNNDVQAYDLTGLPENVADKVKEKFADPEMVWIKRPIPGAIYLLHYLEAHGHSTGIVTARPASVEKETAKFVRARFSDIRFELGLTFVNSQNCIDMKNVPSKYETLKKLAPDYYFDDNVQYCLQAAEQGINTYIVSNKFTPWNHMAVTEDNFTSKVKVLRNVAFFPETLL